jgi:hypothetical protein
MTTRFNTLCFTSFEKLTSQRWIQMVCEKDSEIYFAPSLTCHRTTFELYLLLKKKRTVVSDHMLLL